MAPRVIEMKEDTGEETAAIRRLNQAAGANGDDITSAVAVRRYFRLTGTLPNEQTSKLLCFDIAPQIEIND